MRTILPSYGQQNSGFRPHAYSQDIVIGKPQSIESSRNYLIVFAASQSCQVRVDVRKYDLEPGQFILVNPGKQVKINESAEQGVFQISLRATCLDQWRKQAADTESESVFPNSHGKLELCEQVYCAEESPLGQALLRIASLRNQPSEPEVSWPNLLVGHQWNVYQQLQRLTSAKLSTRKELYRRLCKARRYMINHLDSPLDLDTLSQVACLSKYHFIRLFKEVYGQTPRQYLIARRLEKASMLLKESDLSFHEICHEVGLKDSSSFGRLFKRSFGSTPHIYRRMHAAG